MTGLRAREQELQSVEQGLAALQAEYDGAVKKKSELEFQVIFTPILLRFLM